MTDFEIESQKKFKQEVTFRAVLMGILMVVLIDIWVPYSEIIVRSSRLVAGLFPAAAIIPFILFVIVNMLLKRMVPGLAFYSAELLTVFIMMLVGATIPTLGLTGYFLGVIGTPYYFASSENQWAPYFHQHIPDWIAPVDKVAMQWYYEGMPEGASIPWAAWVIPLFWWLSFIAALAFVSIALVVILRKQWVENERIVFPLTQVPVEMVQQDSEGRSFDKLRTASFVPQFMRERMFWIGFTLPFFIVLWNITHSFYPVVPRIPIEGRQISLAREFPTLGTKVNFPVIGFAYLANLEILFSVWFFHLFSVLHVGINNRFGFAIGARDHWSSRVPSLGWESFGAFVVVVLWWMWMARGHVRDVFRKAFGRNGKVDDSQEIMSYRMAVFGSIVCSIYIAFWLHRSGMDWKVILLFFPATLIIYIGVSRAMAESGLVFLRSAVTAQSFTQFVIGSTAISGPSMTAMAFSYAWLCDTKSFVMPAAFHAAKIGDAIGGNKRKLFWAICVALIVSVIVSIGYTLYLGYHHGVSNFGDWVFDGGNRAPFEMLVSKLRNPFGTDWKRLLFFGIGGSIAGGLLVMRYMFTWWPLSPIGLIVGPFADPIRGSAFSIFIAWACKFLILKFGGIALYRKARPLFLGFVVGFFTGMGISFFVDMIWFPGQGHQIYGW